MAQSCEPNSLGSATSKNLDVKRAATSVATQNDPQPPEEDHRPDPNYQRSGVFRFLDLPGELRNQIYTYATEHAHRCFPDTYSKYYTSMYTCSSRTLRGANHTRIKHPLPSTPLPYLPLTQVCSSIRQEFRSMWLSTHCFPIFALDGYLKAFYPLAPRNAAAKTRFDKAMDPAGTLRVYMRRNGIRSWDILRLLKHKLRFPLFNVTPVSCPMFADDVTIAALGILIGNKNERWVRCIRSHAVRQVRVELEYSQYAGALHVVVAERCSEQWMKMTVPDHVATRRCESLQVELGLQDMPWKVSFGVDYA